MAYKLLAVAIVLSLVGVVFAAATYALADVLAKLTVGGDDDDDGC